MMNLLKFIKFVKLSFMILEDFIKTAETVSTKNFSELLILSMQFWLVPSNVQTNLNSNKWKSCSLTTFLTFCCLLGREGRVAFFKNIIKLPWNYQTLIFRLVLFTAYFDFYIYGVIGARIFSKFIVVSFTWICNKFSFGQFFTALFQAI